MAAVGVAYAQIQTSALNSKAIHPFGTIFDPMAKFAAMGESGGTPGPTVTGCDIYGFRSQIDPDIAVNIGIQRVVFRPVIQPAPPVALPRLLPTISTSTDLGLGIVEQNTLRPVGPALECGNLLAYFKQASRSNNVLTLFGSAEAIGGVFTPSDVTLKRDIQPIENALDILNQLNGYTYEYRTDELPMLNLPEGQRYGFVIQEVEKVMPTIVRQSMDMNGEPGEFKVMEYDAIIPVLTEAIKTQQNTITDLEARVAYLEALILKDRASTKPNNDPMGNASGVQLGQNRPNPTDGSTMIDYVLPKDIANANLVVVDMNGIEVMNQSINGAEASVQLNTSTWAAGAYVYSIVVDGRVLARKKMLVQ